MAGVLSGILLSRTVSGFVGEHLSWRDMFWVSAPLALVGAAMMYMALPDLGAVGVLAAPLAGTMTPMRSPGIEAQKPSTAHANSVSAAPSPTPEWGPRRSAIVLDVGIQVALIANQHIIYALDPQARSRINTIFMTSMFLGAAAGSALAVALWSYDAWSGVSLLSFALASIALAIRLRRRDFGAHRFP
ncbi:MFS permease [Sinorhizobium alkalisoli]|nr:MFS permease [Sinorhizobium alkalisoli]